MSITTADAEMRSSLAAASSRLELRTENEDWIGKTKSAERRKLQNRLNQRAHRRRTLAKRGAATSSEKKNEKIPEQRQDKASSVEADATDSIPNHSFTQVTSRKSGCMGRVPRVQDIMRQFADHAYMSYMYGKPSLLHLPLLARYNVSVALQRNADMLGVTKEYFEWDGLSPFANDNFLARSATSRDTSKWPINMLPTELQRSKPHHPWVDAFPWPQMRDNMMEAFENPNICDEDEMCREVVEFDGHDGEPLLMVWGDASDPRNWEIGFELLKKWVWLLRGCEGSLEATNYWRAKRGEQPISQRMLNSAIAQSIPPQLRTPGL